MDRCFAQVAAVFREAAAARAREERLTAMGARLRASSCCPTGTRCCSRCRRYATSEPEIRALRARGLRASCATVAELAGVTRDETWDFFAHGMLLNVVAMLELDWSA